MSKRHKLPNAKLVSESPWHKHIDAEFPENSHAYKNFYYSTSKGKYFCIQQRKVVINHTKFFGVYSTGDGDIQDGEGSQTVTFMDEEHFLKSALIEEAISIKDVVGTYAG